MMKIKKIAIIMMILALVISAIGCEKVFQVKRIDNTSQAQEKKEANKDKALEKSPEDNKTEEKNETNKAENKDTTKNVAKQEEKSMAEKTEKDDETTENKSEKIKKEEETKQEAAQVATAKPASIGALHHLFLTDKSNEENPGNFKVDYLVGQDHFVHLLAGYYTTANKPVGVNVIWQDAEGKIIYKEEKIEVEPAEKNIIYLHSIIGLTKKVPGQEILPDALGDYWVIIEIEGKVVSKTKYSIVADYK